MITRELVRRRTCSFLDIEYLYTEYLYT
jgi:hypothetical protein